MGWHAGSRWLDLPVRTPDGALEPRRAHVVDVGEGPGVLLLHGFLHSSWTWRETLAALVPRHRVLALDLLGFGWSDRGGDGTLPGFRAWIDGALAALGVERLALACGNSLGGGLALDLAARRPGLVERLAAVSPLGAPLPLPELPLRLLGAPALGPLFRWTAANPAFQRRALGLAAYKRGPVCDARLFGFSTLDRPGSHDAAVRTARGLGPASRAIAAALPTVEQPALVVWGARDGVLPLRSHGRAVADALPAARLEVFDDCGHCAHEEDPARFAAALEALLARPAARRDEPVRAGAPRELARAVDRSERAAAAAA